MAIRGRKRRTGSFVLAAIGAMLCGAAVWAATSREEPIPPTPLAKIAELPPAPAPAPPPVAEPIKLAEEKVTPKAKPRPKSKAKAKNAKLRTKRNATKPKVRSPDRIDRAVTKDPFE